MEPLFLIGTASFALSGYIIGAQKEFDLLGIAIVAVSTAVGGGIIRDILVVRMPIIFHDAMPIAVIMAIIGLSWLLRLHRRDNILRTKIFIVSDSIGLIAFSIAGARVGIENGVNFFGVVSLGFVTAIGGGILRDMMVNDVPFILHRDFYGTVSIIVSALFFALHRFGLDSAPFTYGLFTLGLAVRLFAHAREIRLPRA